MEGMFKVIFLTALDPDQDPQYALKNKMGNFDEADIQKSYTQAQGKDDETVTLASRSRKIYRKLKSRTNTASSPGVDIAPSEDPSFTLGLTQYAAEYEDASLLGGASLALIPAVYNTSILSEDASLTGGDVYPPGGKSLRASTETGHTSSSKVKQTTSILTK